MTSRGTRRGEAAPRGFTLVELLVTMSVAVILLSIGAPPLARFIVSNRLSSHTLDLVGSLQLARAEAIRRGQAVSLRGADTSTHDFAAGWKVFTDLDEDGDIPGSPSPADGTVLRQQGAASGGTTVKRMTRSDPPAPFTYSESSAADRDHVVFNSRGAHRAGTAAYFRVCDAGRPEVEGRIVQVSPVGRVSIENARASCGGTP